jgi:hypothetical protein
MYMSQVRIRQSQRRQIWWGGADGLWVFQAENRRFEGRQARMAANLTCKNGLKRLLAGRDSHALIASSSISIRRRSRCNLGNFLGWSIL